jgi:hypothetical protein
MIAMFYAIALVNFLFDRGLSSVASVQKHDREISPAYSLSVEQKPPTPILNRFS